jgi:hypothetical protein
MKSVKDILRSPEFMWQVSVLLFGLAVLSALFAAVLLVSSRLDPDTLAVALGLLIQTAIYVVLGIMIRRGSIKALWAAGILFTLDTLLAFVLPATSGLGAMIVGRGLLIYVLIRYVRKQRALDS